MHYVCTPIYYIRCPNCAYSSNFCNGLKSCMNMWNLTEECVHLKRTLQAMINDVIDNFAKLKPGTFIGLLFQLIFLLFYILCFNRIEIFSFVILSHLLHVTFYYFVMVTWSHFHISVFFVHIQSSKKFRKRLNFTGTKFIARLAENVFM